MAFSNWFQRHFYMILMLQSSYLYNRRAHLLNWMRRGGFKKQYFVSLSLRVLKWADKNRSFCHHCNVVNYENCAAFWGKRVSHYATPSWVNLYSERAFWSQRSIKMWKIKYLLPNQVNDDYLWKESDLRCLLDRGDSFLLLFLISTRTSFLFKRLPCTGKKGTLKSSCCRLYFT